MSRAQRKRNAEKWADEQIAKADRFSVVLFVGAPQLYDKRWTSSLADARCLKRRMITEYGNTNSGRQPMIYAIVPPNDITVFVE